MNIYEIELTKKVTSEVQQKNMKWKKEIKTETVYFLFAGINAMEAKAKARQTINSPQWKVGKVNCIINNK